MSTKLKNVSGHGLDMYAIAGEPGSFTVPEGETVELPGDITNADDTDADHYMIGEGENARAWPKSAWELVGAKAPAKAPAKATTPTPDTEGK